MLYCLLICSAVVVLDQISKLIVVNTIAEGTVIEVIKGVFNLTYVENKGAAFGMLSGHRWVFMIISAVAIVLIFLYLWKEAPESFVVKTCLAFVLGGGVGNMIDRTVRGSVVDFIDAAFVRYPQISTEGGFNISLEPFPIFNVADCFITVGCVSLVVYLLFVELPKEARAERERKAKAGAENNLTNAENVAESEADEQ